jgi:hypothetical protein
MKFAYEDLSYNQFEDLVLFLCKRLLGISTQGFSDGRDGGRDARFHGTAECHPSEASPWNGIVIVQAKHTNGYNRHFSESDFFSKSRKDCVIEKELPRIKRLRDSNELDYYMLFSNRRLAGEAETAIRNRIAAYCQMDKSSVYLCGIEGLESFLKQFPDVADQAGIDPIDSPLLVSPDELAEIVQSLSSRLADCIEVLESVPVPRVSYDEKNKLNMMSVEYAKLQRRRYLKDLKETAQIRAFLAQPENAALLIRYEIAADEFQLKITSKRKDYQSYDEVMEYLASLLFSRDPVLNSHKRLTRVLLFYMYWNCDIGQAQDVETIETLAS